MKLNFLKTRLQSVLFIKSIEKCLEDIYSNTSEEVIDIVSHYMPEEVVYNIKSNYKDRDSAVKYLSELKHSVESLEVFHMTLPFIPREEFLKQLHKLISTHNKDDFLLDIDVNTTMLGGLTLERQGKYFDYSLNKLVDTYLDNNSNHEL